MMFFNKRYLYVAIFTILSLVLLNSNSTQAQHSEIGLWIGGGMYVGDLNPNYSPLTSRPALGAIYRYTVSEYIVLKAGFNATMVEQRDENSNNPFPLARNLSFRTNIFELSGQVDLHFRKYIIGSKKHAFTPYVTTGLAFFYFRPRAKFDNEWYSLQQLGTEGQLNSDFTGNKQYKLIQPAIPIGMGIKYWMYKGWNFYVELAYRQTFTDYIDDVSDVFIDSFLLGDGTITAELADRSDEVGASIADTGKQRGDVTNNDAYIMLNVGITYTIFNRRCPRSK